MENTTEQEEQKEKASNNSEGTKNPTIIAAILAALLSIWLFFKYLASRNTKIYKGKLITKYSVDPKTFAKWMELLYFNGDKAKFDEYTKKKKISQHEADEIIKFFGERPKGTQALNKGKIIKLHGGSYKSLRNSVLTFSTQIGITMDVYDALDTFPPKLTESILEHYRG